MTRKRVIGNDDALPWHIVSEIEHFRKIVRGQILIMGRNTFEVMRNGLVSSHNIVITHSKIDSIGVDSCSSLEDALSKAHTYGPDVFIVGGQSIFEQSIGIADVMELSFIKKEYAGNKFFPQFDPDEWNMSSREDFPEFEYVVYVRK